MPVTSPQGTLDFKKVDKITFVGASSNTVIDTTTGRVGIGVVGDALSSNLHVVGDTRIEGNINMLHTSNTASIKLNSNVVTEFSRSKKLIKYPRVAMTNSASGGYEVDASTEFLQNYIWKAFDQDSNTVWHADHGSHLWDSSGDYIGGVELITGHDGDWITLKLPTNERISPRGIRVFPRGLRTTFSAGQAPKDVVVIGSNDGSSWDVIATTTLTNYSFGTNPSTSTPDGEEYIPATFDFEATEYYQYVGIIIESIYTGGHMNPSISQLEFLGIPEYDPEAHGTDVVVKSVPNVPNTDWLEVYYDAKNYSGVGDVQDETTNNRDAVMNATFDNSEIKAFSFNGTYTSNVTTSDHGLGTGDVMYTMSYWFKRTAVATNYDYVVMLGNGGTNYSSILMWINTNQLVLDHWNASLRVVDLIKLDKWYHVVAGHKGGDTPSLENDFIYIDGKKVTPQITQTPAAFTLAGSKLTLGASHLSTTEFFNGKIANFRLFDRVLNSDEVWQLYAYQKEYFGHGDLNLTLKAGRLGIGTSDPGAVLDVNGVISFTENSFDIRYSSDAEWPASAGYPNWYSGQDIGSQFMWRTLGSSGGEYFLYHVPRNGILMVNVTMIHRLLQFRASSTTHAVYWCLRKSTDNGATWNPLTSKLIGHRWVSRSDVDQEWHPVNIPFTGRVNEGDQVALFVQNEWHQSGSTFTGNFQVYDCRMSGVLI